MGELAKVNPNIVIGSFRTKPGAELAAHDDPKVFGAKVIQIVTLMFEGAVFKNSPKNLDAASQAWIMALRGRVPLAYLEQTCMFFVQRGGWAPTAEEFAQRAESVIRDRQFAVVQREMLDADTADAHDRAERQRSEMLAKGLDPADMEHVRRHVREQMGDEFRRAVGPIRESA